MSSETILQEAERIVDGPRREAYGHPRENFARTACIWTEVLRPKLREGESISPEDVALLMIALKLARASNAITRDTLVDMAGYARTLELLGSCTPATFVGRGVPA